MGEMDEEAVDRIPDIDPVLQAERDAKKKSGRVNSTPTIDKLPPTGIEPDKNSSLYLGVDPKKMERDFKRVRPRKDIDE